MAMLCTFALHSLSCIPGNYNFGYYIWQTFQHILNKMDSNANKTVKELRKAFSMLNCIEIVASSIKELKQTTLKRSWKKLWPEGVLKCSVVLTLNFEISRILNVSHRFSGEGFDDMTEDDTRVGFYITSVAIWQLTALS